MAMIQGENKDFGNELRGQLDSVATVEAQATERLPGGRRTGMLRGVNAGAATMLLGATTFLGPILAEGGY